MAEQDKDLPLVVAEILIEMHGMNDRLQGVDNRLENVENIMLQAVANIQQLSKAVNRTAEVLLQQQQEFNRRFDQRQKESDRRFELLLEADRQQADRLERAIASIENRFERLENN
jgi:tetrahydromethanopterin S-methyltransferase subunit G